MAFQDFFSGHAADYSAFRPTYPAALFAHLAANSPGRQRAWDCATGNGQAAAALADHFHEVCATDGSRNQLAAATRRAGVSYLAALAEQCPLADQSVDLVTVAQAMHWFARPRFYQEVRRVLRPGGMLAAWAYSVFQISPRIDAVIDRLYDGILGPYWAPERRIVEQAYRTIEFPFEDVLAPAYTMLQQWSLPQVLAYLNTWSAVKNYEARQGRSPLLLVREELLQAWGDADTTRPVTWPVHLRIGRV